MKRILKRVFFLSLCLFFLLTGNLLASARLEKGRSNVKAADFVLESSESGESVSLSDFKGQPVIMFFFTTWCPYCIKTVSELSKKQDVYKEQKIQLLLIDVGESRQKVKSFIENKNLALEVLLDADSKTATRYGVIGVPTYVLIAANGTIQYQGNDLPRDYPGLLKD